MVWLRQPEVNLIFSGVVMIDYYDAAAIAAVVVFAVNMFVKWRRLKKANDKYYKELLGMVKKANDDAREIKESLNKYK